MRKLTLLVAGATLLVGTYLFGVFASGGWDDGCSDGRKIDPGPPPRRERSPAPGGGSTALGIGGNKSLRGHERRQRLVLGRRLRIPRAIGRLATDRLAQSCTRAGTGSVQTRRWLRLCAFEPASPLLGSECGASAARSSGPRRQGLRRAVVGVTLGMCQACHRSGGVLGRRPTLDRRAPSAPARVVPGTGRHRRPDHSRRRSVGATRAARCMAARAQRARRAPLARGDVSLVCRRDVRQAQLRAAGARGRGAARLLDGLGQFPA